MSRFIKIEDEDTLPSYVLKEDITKVEVTDREEFEDDNGKEYIRESVTISVGDEETYEISGQEGLAAAIVLELEMGDRVKELNESLKDS